MLLPHMEAALANARFNTVFEDKELADRAVAAVEKQVHGDEVAAQTVNVEEKV